MYNISEISEFIYIYMFGLKHKIYRGLGLSLVQYKSNGKPKAMKPFNPVEHGLP